MYCRMDSMEVFFEYCNFTQERINDALSGLQHPLG